MQLEQKVIDILERNNFGIAGDIYSDVSGNGYVVLIYEKVGIKKEYHGVVFDGTTKGFINGVYEAACDFDIDDAAEKRRKDFSRISDVVHYMEKRRANLFELYNDLDGGEFTGKYLEIKKLKKLTEYYLTLEDDLMDAGEATDILEEIEDAAIDFLIDDTNITPDEMQQILYDRRK